MRCPNCQGNLVADENDIKCYQCGRFWYGHESATRTLFAPVKQEGLGRPRKFTVGDKVTLNKSRRIAKHWGHIGTVIRMPEQGKNLYRVACSCGRVRLWTAAFLEAAPVHEHNVANGALPYLDASVFRNRKHIERYEN